MIRWSAIHFAALHAQLNSHQCISNLYAVSAFIKSHSTWFLLINIRWRRNRHANGEHNRVELRGQVQLKHIWKLLIIHSVKNSMHAEVVKFFMCYFYMVLWLWSFKNSISIRWNAICPSQNVKQQIFFSVK